MTGRGPLATTCPRCGARVLQVQWDHHQDVLIGSPLLDPVSLDRTQVTACVIAGIDLWQVQRHLSTHTTSHRTFWWPKHPVPGHTAPMHICGRVWDAFPLELAPEPAPAVDECPF